MKTLGIDISEWQEGLSLRTVKNAGVEFVILRGSYSTSMDDCFNSFYQEARNVGLKVGVYHYVYATTVAQAKKEAEFFYNNVLRGRKFEYPVCLDIEYTPLLAKGKTLVSQIVVAMADYLEKKGYYVCAYASLNTLNNYFDSTTDRFDKWVAQWNTQCNYTKSYGLWQFGGETNYIRDNKISGYTVDMDYALYNYPEIIIANKLNGFYTESTIADLAVNVMRDVYGKGDERKKQLGDKYESVQERVNQYYREAENIMAGKYGNGETRFNTLENLGYNDEEQDIIQNIVNEMWETISH